MAVLHASLRASTHMRQPVTLNGQDIAALCDTAAPGCVRCATTLTPSERLRLQPYDGPRLVGADTAELTILGTVLTTVTIQRTTFEIPFVVCRPLAVAFLLGWDFMRRHVCHIDPQFNEWSVLAWCPPHLDSYAPAAVPLSTADTTFCEMPPLTSSSTDATDSTSVLDDILCRSPAATPHQRGPCFSDLALIMYHLMPPFTNDISHQARVTAWCSIFAREDLPVMVLTPVVLPQPTVKLECLEDFADSPSSPDYDDCRDLAMQCPLCKQWAQAFDICQWCAHRLGITFGGLPSTTTREAYTLNEQSPTVPFDAANELVPPPSDIQTHVDIYPGRYTNAIVSAAAYLTSGPTFVITEFHLVAEVVVTDVLMITSREPVFREVHRYTMAAIELKLRPFVIPDAHLRESLSDFHGPEYRPTPMLARTHALTVLQARRGVPVYLHGQVFYMRNRADVQLCIDLQILTPLSAAQPGLLPVDRISTRFTPQVASFLRMTVSDFDTVIANNAQSAHDLGLSNVEPGRHVAPAGEPASMTTTFRRDPYMTRGRTARLRAESGEPERPRRRQVRRSPPSSSTAAGPLQGPTTSRTASTPIVDTSKGDFVAAGERVVPGAQPAVFTASERETS